MKKNIFTLIAILAITVAAFGSNRGLVFHEVEIIDEFGRAVTDITSVTVRTPGTTSAATIYKDEGLTLEMTNPVTTSSTNFTLADGKLYWWGPDGWDFTVTDGTFIHTNYGHNPLSASSNIIYFPSYLISLSTTTYADAGTATFGTDSDWVLNGGATANLLSWTPSADNAVFRIGASGTTLNPHFQVYTGTGVGFLINPETPALTITGLTTSINTSSNYATNINTGTSTGAVTIGSSTSGAWSIDGTSTGSIVADSTIGMSNTDASADITIDSTAGSLKLDGGEAAEDAVTIVSAGGMDISLVDDFDLSLVSGATDENMSFVLSGATASSIIVTSSGTGADAIDINVSAGGIDIDMAGGAAGEDFSVTTATSVTMTSTENAAQSIHLEENGGTSGTITLYANQGVSTTEKAAAIQLLADAGSIELWSGLNGADAVNIMVDGDTASGITIFNDTGTGDESVVVKSDVGGITVNAAAGSVDIEAVGAETGDIGINAGDDMTLTATGDLTLAVTGTLSAGGAAWTNMLLATEVVVGTTDELTEAQSGSLIAYTMTTSSCTVSLPEATASNIGMWFVLVDADPTGGEDLIIDPEGDGTINGDTAGHYIKNDSIDTDGVGVLIFSTAADTWHAVYLGGAAWTEE